MSEFTFGQVWRDSVDGETIMVISPPGRDDPHSVTAMILDPGQRFPSEDTRGEIGSIESIYMYRRLLSIGGWKRIDDAE